MALRARSVLKKYLRSRAFDVEEHSGRAVLQGTRARENGLVDVVHFVSARDGTRSAQSLMVGLRVEAVDSEIESRKKRMWSAGSQANEFSIPARMAIYSVIDLQEGCDEGGLVQLVDQEFTRFHEQFRDVLGVRNEIERRRGFGERGGRPIFDPDWALWIEIFNERHHT